jgi:putative N6-adenine-specific DNA methylase
VARELKALGEQPRIDDGGVSWEGDARSMMRANLWLRTASRVLVRVARFRATEFFELEKRSKKIEWSRFLQADRIADFRVTARKSKLYHSDAIAQRLQSASKSEASNEATATRAQLFVVRVVRDTVEISADTSGQHLHMRGYRQAVGKAPLRETLAAALLLAADWTGDAPLLDPFCGSGTIPIEAALIARRVAPGLRREFAFQRWPQFDERAWRTLLAEGHANERAAPCPILGSDRDAGAIDSASANAMRAGVTRDISFAVAAISNASPPASTPGALVATNPPYGKRVGGGRDIRDLYAQLGNVMLQRFPDWRLALYAPDLRLARQTRIPLEEMYRTTNGGIHVVALCSGRDLSH